MTQPLQPPLYVRQPASGAAAASLVFGLIGMFGGFCLFGLPCLLAVLFGHLGMRDTRDGAQSGRGMAVAGLILGYVFVIPAVIVVAMGGIGTVFQ